jgi:outer membrane protein assembly factor BamB
MSATSPGTDKNTPKVRKDFSPGAERSAVTRDRPVTSRRGLLAAGLAAGAALAGCLEAPGENGVTGADATATDTTTGDGSGDTASPAARADATFRGGLRRQGYHPDVTVPAAVEREWEVSGINKGDHTAAKASAVRSPGGDLVVPGDDGTVYAVRPDGQIRWAAATHPSAYGVHGTPTVANDTVYVGAYDGAMYAFDLATGRRRWRTELGDAIGSSPAYHQGRLYVGVEFLSPSDGSLFALDADGRVLEERPDPDDHPHSTPAVDPEAGHVVMGSNDGRCYGWEYPSLVPAWSHDTGAPIKGPVAVHDGGAVFGSWSNEILRLDLATGEEVWRYRADNDVMSGPAIDTDAGVVYVGSHDRRLHAIDFETGERRWRFDTGGWITGCPTVTAESVLVGSYDGRCYAVDPATGAERWSVRFPGWITCAPLPVGDAVYVTERATDDTAGGLYRLGPV